MSEEGEISDSEFQPGETIELGNWDDSALIDSWNKAEEEYHKHFSIKKHIRQIPKTLGTKRKFKEPEIDFQVLVPDKPKESKLVERMVQSYFKGYFKVAFEPKDSLEKVWYEAGRTTVDYKE